MHLAALWFPAIGICLHLLLPGAAYGTDTAGLREGLRSYLQAADPAHLEFAGETLRNREMLRRFYETRAYRPAWFDHTGPTENLLELKQALATSREQGLTPADYHLHAIIPLLERVTDRSTAAPEDRLLAELLLTDAYLLVASHYRNGRLEREFRVPAWHKRRQEIDLPDYLTTSLERDKILDNLLQLLPQSTEYQGLARQLNQYRIIAHAGGWGQIDSGPKLQLGDRGPRVEQLRGRLRASQDLQAALQNWHDGFDGKLDEAVRRFQARHGLSVDGIVGPITLAALNISVEQRTQQIRINLERLRWLPRQPNHESIRVNIADFRLQARTDDRPVFEMKIIVGRPYRQTPMFSEQMTYLVLNPTWHVPRNIALRDKLPLIQKDPAYLKRHGYTLYQQQAGAPQVIEPFAVDWSSPEAKTFPYRLRQAPGPNNALGRIKFMLPNRFNVYLHDTPEQELFSRTTRTFSSGCIRLERPLQLAVWVLQEQPDWDRAALELAIANGRERVIKLPQPIPVDFIYLTAWVTQDGVMQFREDIYRRDPKVAAALEHNQGP